MRRILAIVGVLVVALVGVALWRWLSQPDATTLAAPDVAGTVVLIPGYGGGADGLTGLAGHLQAQGRPVIVADIGDGHGDIAGYGRQVASLAAAAIAQGAPSVDLVGYSMGGLIARSAAAQAPQAVRRVVTIASPHDGTSVAGLGAFLGDATTCPLACQQMAPGSDFLDALPVADGEDRWLSAWSSTDEVVRPAESGVLPGAADVEVTSACGTGPLDHGGIVRATATWDLAAAFLSTGRVTAACGG